METDTHNKVTPVSQQAVNWRTDRFKAENLFGSGQVAPVVRKNSSKAFKLNLIALQQFLKFQ